MSVTGLALDPATMDPIVLLRDQSGLRQVPICINHDQAHNIMAGLKNSHSQQPLSHDLMVSLLKIGNLHLDRVIIHALEKERFHAVLIIHLSNSQLNEKNNSSSLKEIEAHPSDAIALAIRTKKKIWMLEEVVSKASLPVDAEADAKDQNKFKDFIDQLSPSSLARHLKDHDKKQGDQFNLPDNNY